MKYCVKRRGRKRAVGDVEEMNNEYTFDFTIGFPGK